MGAAICWAAIGGAEATHKDRARPVVDKSRMTAESLLSRWNAPNCGGFDLTTLWEVDTQIAADMVTVFATVPARHRHPDDLGYGEEFRRIIHAWRPPLQRG